MLAPSLLALTLPLLLTAAVGLQWWRDRGWAPYEPAIPLLWVRDAGAVRAASLGFDSLVADVYWMRAVVSFGRERLSTRLEKKYEQLFPLLDVVTTLDPRFTLAYRFGAIFLAEPPPGGPGRPDQAVLLLKRGAEANPTRWEYFHDIGFVYAWSTRDYREAAGWFERAAAIEGAPLWLKSTAASMLIREGDRDAARALWRQMYEHTDVGPLKDNARIHLAQFDALDAIDALNELVWRTEARTGRLPITWQELVSAGVLRGVPLDPAGVPFEINPTNEDVRLSRRSPLWPLPAHESGGRPQ